MTAKITKKGEGQKAKTKKGFKRSRSQRSLVDVDRGNTIHSIPRY